MIDNELDEIIFAEREKGYGAFYLRKRHRRIVLFSLVLAVILIGTPVTLMFLPYLSSHDATDWKSVTLEEFNKLDSLEYLPPPPLIQVELQLDAKRFDVADSVPETIIRPKITALRDSSRKASDSTKMGNNEGEKKNAESLYVFVEQMPEFPGGADALNTYITNRLDLNSYIKTRKLSGTVTVSFCINKLGAVTDVKIVNSFDTVVDRGVDNLFRNMPNWKPAIADGKPIKLQFVMPVNVSYN